MGSWVLMCTTGTNEDFHWVPAGLQNLVALPDNVDSLGFALHQGLLTFFGINKGYYQLHGSLFRLIPPFTLLSA